MSQTKILTVFVFVDWGDISDTDRKRILIKLLDVLDFKVGRHTFFVPAMRISKVNKLLLIELVLKHLNILLRCVTMFLIRVGYHTCMILNHDLVADVSLSEHELCYFVLKIL